MRISEALRNVRRIHITRDGPPVFRTTAMELAEDCGATIVEDAAPGDPDKAGGIWLVDSLEKVPGALRAGLTASVPEHGMLLRLDPAGTGFLVPSDLNLLFGFIGQLSGHCGDGGVESVTAGRAFPTAFSWQRVVFDFFLTQEGRIQRGLDKEAYVRRLAMRGFTHVEVNGLAYPMGLETGPKGETYSMFYTYCPALDQFVDSELNKGLYPRYYLAANLENLKENARLATRYGLTPGLLCFEPRSVPEEFFARYPMLRGARVDHPFRSFKPRYNMTIAHRRVREHYAEMMRKLVEAVPELGFIAIWTNDSGAGFEHTNSLYVGRNGGPYLIREWKNASEIARAAGGNALRFLRVLRDAGASVSPDFRVITRMEPFRDEHDTVWNGLGDRIDVEAASLLSRGWEMPYSHVQYPDSHSIIGGSVHQNAFDKRETKLNQELERRGSLAHFYVACGPWAIFAPLLGVPYPWLTGRRLRMLRDDGVAGVAHMGGICPPALTPYDINHEIVGAYQFNPDLDVDRTVRKIAETWAGEAFADDLLRAWKMTEEAILAYPHITPLYSALGFTWYRLWARPLVPDIEAIPESERAYHQEFMCTTPHNPNNVDLSRDVLFELASPDGCRRDVERIDKNLRGPMGRAVEMLSIRREEAKRLLGDGNVIEDQWVRLAALQCWFMTQRNVGAWIVGVRGFMESSDAAEKDECRSLVREMIRLEIDNTRNLKELLGTGIEFMAMTDRGETPLIHGENLSELLERRMALMHEHMDDEPYIDPEYIERQAGKAMS